MPFAPLVDEGIPSVSAVANFSLSLLRIPAILAVPVCLLCIGQAYCLTPANIAAPQPGATLSSNVSTCCE